MNRSRLIYFPIRALVLGFTVTLSTLCAHAQTITEIIDATGDGSNALANPVGVAVDASGNVYVAGATTDNAFKITPAGVITQIIDATGDGSGSNPLDRPYGIAVDPAGNVYLTGVDSDNAFKITPAGVITEIIDATGDGSGKILTDPSGIAVDASGNVYVAGATTDNAFKITPAGVITEIIDATGDGSNSLDNPTGIAVDVAGNVYVTGYVSNNAFKITPAGVITEIIDATGDGSNALSNPSRIAVDPAGNVYLTGVDSHNAFKITSAGTITEIIDTTGDGSNSLRHAFGIAADAAGNVYVTGLLSYNAFKITPAGVISEIIDLTGDGSGHNLSAPNGIAADAADNVFVTGLSSDNAFKIDLDEDDDGVLDTDDLCPGTVIPEATVPSKGFLGKLRWALFDGDTEFDTYDPKSHALHGYNTDDTGGCSCEQIIPMLNLGGGAVKAGCDVKGMDAWVAYVSSLGKGATFAPGVAASEGLPEAFTLEGNYPNPFNPSTTLRFDVPEEAHVLLVVYDVTGREIARLLDQTVEAGAHEVRWDAHSAPSGTYFYRLTAGAFSQTKVMMLLR